MTVDPAFLKTYEKEDTLCPEDILAAPSSSGKSSCISVPPASNRLLGI